MLEAKSLDELLQKKRDPVIEREGISEGESLFATLFLQRAINSVRFEVTNS